MERWYVLFTKAKSEKRVATILTEQGIEVFLPQIRVCRSGKSTYVTETLFPCYLFMYAVLEQLSTLDWQWTPGLRYMLHFAGEPAVVPDSAIDNIRKEIVRRNESGMKKLDPFQRGDMVRVTGGPLAEFLAVFDGLVDGSTRSQVLVDFLGRVCRAKVDLHFLEKVASNSAERSSPLRRRTRGRGRRITTERTDHSPATSA